MRITKIEVNFNPVDRSGEYQIKLWYGEKSARVIYLSKEEYQWLKQEMSYYE